MNHRTVRTAAAALALLATAAARAADTPEPDAVARCEAQVQETLARTHGKNLRGVRFDAAGRSVQRASGDEATLRGAGRYQLDGGGAAFQYSCSADLKTGEVSGAVVRDAGVAAAQARRERDWEPDLAKISPADCEAAAAALLTSRHPRIGRITFDAETRRLEPAEPPRIGLDGRGALQRAPGMLAAPFSYHCEFDARSGRVVAVSASE